MTQAAVTTATDGTDIPVAATKSPGFLESEDWLAVWIGFLSLGLALAGVMLSPPTFAWRTAGDLAASVANAQNLGRTLAVAGVIGILSSAGVVLMKGSVPRFALGFPVLYALAWGAQIIAGNLTLSALGFEYVIFAFALGLGVSNFIGVPAWLKEAARSEYYIKTGLVILGAGIVFNDLVRAGLLGIAQALLVVSAVWFVCFRLARTLRVDDELATMLAAAVSICGVSAAIAACGAIQGDRRKLSYVMSLVLIVAAPMLVIMPQIVNAFGIPDSVGGAWLGGTLDTSPSVVAAGEMISDRARTIGVVVKLSQNVLIGVAAFLLTIWWTLRERPASGQGRPDVRVIWRRFPKFVLGFVAASLIFSFLLDPALVKRTGGLLTGLRTVWFALAFASIGLETRFAELARAGGGRAAVAFLGGQAFNVLWTLLIPYLLFGGMLFAVPNFE
jgi:uncharacterized membrane protein YadS